MEDDDDISEFGTLIPDPNTPCTVNEFRDGWVMIKGYLPFPISDVCGTQVPGVIFFNEGVHRSAVNCNDPEKFEVFKKVRHYINAKRRHEDQFVPIHIDDLFDALFNDPDDAIH